MATKQKFGSVQLHIELPYLKMCPARDSSAAIAAFFWAIMRGRSLIRTMEKPITTDNAVSFISNVRRLSMFAANRSAASFRFRVFPPYYALLSLL
ncbi:MAG: hypothetical protein LBT46_01670 [Planctomycetaceae bacterium]|nr:hypothetical protein [Planctomycetaceae bacterium]